MPLRIFLRPGVATELFCDYHTVLVGVDGSHAEAFRGNSPNNVSDHGYFIRLVAHFELLGLLCVYPYSSTWVHEIQGV